MIFGQDVKSQSLVKAVSVATGATATAHLDTLGFDYAQIYVVGDTASSAISVLKLSEGDTTSAFTDIVAFTGGTAVSTSVGFVIPSADTSTPPDVRMDIDLRQRKRYLKIWITPGVAGLMEATSHLSRAGVTPAVVVGSTGTRVKG